MTLAEVTTAAADQRAVEEENWGVSVCGGVMVDVLTGVVRGTRAEGKGEWRVEDESVSE